MKSKVCQLIILFCLITSGAFSQATDSLSLEIKSLKSLGVILKFFGKDTVTYTRSEGQLNINTNPWVFNVATKQNVYIVISNTEGEGKLSDTITDLNKTYVLNNNLLDESFSLQRNFKIEVFNKANNQIIKNFQLSYNQKQATTSATLPEAPPDYKVGSMIFDALYLSKGTSVGIKGKILSYYANGVTGQDLLARYANNEFLDSLANSIITRAGQQGALKLGSVFSSIGGLDVTSFADGAAKFIVKRAKQELSMAFFQKFKKIIEQTPDIKTVFPQTANLLDGLDEEIYEYEKYIQNLREAFKMDIRNIHRNLPGIIDNHTAFFSRHQEEKCALLTACYTARELDDQAHPGDILANYPSEYLDSIANKNYKGSIQTIQLFSASLRDTSTMEDAPYWANIKTIRELVSDRVALKIYLGLILQEAKIKYGNVPFQDFTLVDALNDVAKQYDKVSGIYNSYKTFVFTFGEKVESLNKMIKEYSKEDTSDSAIVEKYAKYFRTSVDLVAYSSEICNLPVIRDKDHLKEFPLLLRQYFNVAYSCVNLVVDINRKNYSSAINQTVHIYNSITVKPSEDQTEMVFNNTERKNSVNGSNYSLQGNSANLATNPNAHDLAYNVFKTTQNRLIKYGSFMATVATARNSDEVENAIETAALPVGSSRVKRVSDFNVSLNAYAGIFYGIERIKGVDSGATKFNSFGVAAPIGVAASWGHRLFFIPTGTHEWSTSIYISLIDLGAVASFRFRDDSTAQVPKIELKDIFSPGAFLSIGIPKTPLSLNLGAQAGPNLRKIGDGKNDYNNNVYWRYSVSVCVDIPVFNFYTKSQ